jgi:hypothetical protein
MWSEMYKAPYGGSLETVPGAADNLVFVGRERGL